MPTATRPALDTPVKESVSSVLPARLTPATPASTLDQYQGDPNFMTSLARGLIVIQAFTQQTPQMTISQLSVKTGLSRAAVRRCLYTLTKLGFAGAEDGQRYALRPRMLIALPHLHHLVHPLHRRPAHPRAHVRRPSARSFSVATLDGDEIVYIARTQVPSRVMAVDLHIGSRLPAYCTSMGRVLLAYLPPDQLEAYLARAELIPHTTRTITSVEKLRAHPSQRPPPRLRAGRSGARSRPPFARRPGLRPVGPRRRHRQPLRQRPPHARLRHAEPLPHPAPQRRRRTQRVPPLVCCKLDSALPKGRT